ncbi:hypothetical protein CPB84DRAFT_1828157 [Gymnopilus junonius]|uniref:Uncharacterized protein n=1 Tax=Gymnopilus junonius TaxID=109634 RepID=A0A9P5TI92_GYMJU|nr:hypothetical protein CPB84DRAFT_1828157 [Gymnopilus junonius]
MRMLSELAISSEGQGNRSDARRVASLKTRDQLFTTGPIHPPNLLLDLDVVEHLFLLFFVNLALGSKYPLETLENAVEYLRLIYNPPVRGSRRRKTVSGAHKDTKLLHGDSLENDLESLRTDSFERTYSITWLTTVISQLEVDSEEADIGSGFANRRREALVENAASLLATCAGTASAGLITRCFTFDLINSPTPITVELTDIPLDNRDYGSVGAQTWGGACVMAEMITESPEAFGLPTSPTNVSTSTLRYLELGAGTGLVGLTVAKTMERLTSQRKLDLDVDVVATDYYPTVLANLERNIQSNFRRAETSTHAVESSTIEEAFPSRSDSFDDDGWALVVKHKEIIICDAESGKNGEEVEYAYYRIGWSGHKTKSSV